MSITSLRGSTLPNKSFRASRAKTRNVVTIAPDTATTFANGASISAGGGGGSSVTISNVSVTDSGYIVSNATPYIDSAGGYIKITGTGFATGCTVYVGGSAATSTTFISSTEVRAQVGAAASNAQSVYVVNTDSSVAILLNAITYSGTPSWSTDASLGTQISDVAFTIPLSATSDSSIVYTLASGSSTPSGTTLFSNGVFAGTVTGITSDTNYSFTVVATDIENQLSARAFTVTVSSGDQYFNTTALLLNGEANVWIRDSSTNNFAHTIAGDTKPAAFSPYNTNWSAYFDGSGDYLTLAHTTELNLSSGNFTLEAWVYWNGVNASSALLSKDGVSGSSYPSYSMGISSSKLTIYLGSGNGVSSLQTIPSTIVFPANQWVHVAVVKSGTVITMFHNGANIAAATQTATITDGGKALLIGYETGQPTSSYWSGYISNTRIVKGVAVYTGNFTPQTSSLSSTQSAGSNIAAITTGQTVFLGLQTYRFIDSNTTPKTITVSGDTAIKSFGPFTETDTTTGSGYFDSSGDYIAATIGAIGSGNFTIEFWSYQPGAASRMYYFMTGSTPEWGDANGVQLLEYDGYLALNVGGTSSITIAPALPRNQWQHVAIVRNSGVTTTYINGLAASTTLSNSADLTGTLYRIGVGPTNSGSWFAYYGYMTDFRIVTGTAVYTANFTPTTTSLTSIANTKLLTLQYRRGDNNHRFVDEAGIKHLLTRGGNASQGSFSPFSPAGWSHYFDGSSYYDFTASTTFNEFLTGDFTVECWIYYTGTDSFSGNPNPLSVVATWSTAVAYEIEVQSGGVVRFAAGNNIPIDLKSSGAGLITANAWYHVAAARASGVTRLFINGANVAAHSGSVSISQASTVMRIGAFPGGGNKWTGYISDLRIVKGQAAYTANFTPATSSLTTTSQSITSANVFLGCNTNRFIDANTTPKTISSFTSAPKVQAFSPFRPSASYSPSLHGGSAYFDGTGDYVATVSTTSTILPAASTSTFTIDGWLYPTSLGALKWIIGDMQPTGGTNNVSVDISSSNYIELYWYDGVVKRATSTTAVVLNQWNYFAIVVNSNAITIYVNSTTAGQGGTTTLTNRNNGTTGWAIGAFNSTDYYTGYMSGIRWTNGVARTISSIPTAPPSLDANTSVLMNFTQGGVVDASARNVIETVADAKISNVASKFGTGAMYFDGTGDYLTARNNPNQGFGIGDFTIECWMYCTDASTYRGLMGQGDGSTQGWGLYFNPNPTPLIIFVYGGSISYGAGVVVIGSWCHVAVTRYGTGSNNLRFYVNGSLVSNTTVTNNLSSTSPTYIGATAGGSYPFMGYLDDVRITAGYARYTGSSLAVPTQTFLTK